MLAVYYHGLPFDPTSPTCAGWTLRAHNFQGRKGNTSMSTSPSGQFFITMLSAFVPLFERPNQLGSNKATKTLELSCTSSLQAWNNCLWSSPRWRQARSSKSCSSFNLALGIVLCFLRPCFFFFHRTIWGTRGVFLIARGIVSCLVSAIRRLRRGSSYDFFFCCWCPPDEAPGAAEGHPCLCPQPGQRLPLEGVDQAL